MSIKHLQNFFRSLGHTVKYLALSIRPSKTESQEIKNPINPHGSVRLVKKGASYYVVILDVKGNEMGSSSVVTSKAAARAVYRKLQDIVSSPDTVLPTENKKS